MVCLAVVLSMLFQLDHITESEEEEEDDVSSLIQRLLSPVFPTCFWFNIWLLCMRVETSNFSQLIAFKLLCLWVCNILWPRLKRQRQVWFIEWIVASLKRQTMHDWMSEALSWSHFLTVRSVERQSVWEHKIPSLDGLETTVRRYSVWSLNLHYYGYVCHLCNQWCELKNQRRKRERINCLRWTICEVMIAPCISPKSYICTMILVHGTFRLFLCTFDIVHMFHSHRPTILPTLPVHDSWA